MMSFQKTILLPLIALSVLLPGSIYGQLAAGNVPPGTSVLYAPVEMSVIENHQDTTTFIDLDGDGLDDVRIWLLKGSPPIDAPNTVIFFALGNTFSFCNWTEKPEHVALYHVGDTLCLNEGVWGIDSIYTVGCYGGWNCIQDESPIVDQYVAYRKNATNEIGWLKVSMSLFANIDQMPVTFTISEMLVLYLGTNIHKPETVSFFELFPNPTLNGLYSIESERKILKVEVFNAVGQLVSIHHDDGGEYSLPEMNGIYYIRALDMEGHYSTRRIIRL